MARDFSAASSQYLEAPFSIASFPVTICCWARLNDDTSRSKLVSLQDSSSSRDWIQIEAVEGDKVRAYHRRSSTEWAESTTGYSAETWIHVCGVFTSASSRTVYLNGGNEATNTDTLDDEISTFDTLTIGVSGDSSPSDYADGQIAEVGIWNAALTAAEVAMLAAGVSPLFVRPENLMHVIPLINENDIDIVGGANITAYNSPTWAEHVPIIYPASTHIGVPATGGASTIQAEATDGAELSDSNTALGQYLTGLTDGVNLSDSSSAVATLLAGLTDGSNFTDASAAVAALLAGLSDGSNFTDTPSASVTLRVNVSDGSTFTDAVQIVSGVVGVVSDGVTMSDVSAREKKLHVLLSDGAEAADTVSVVKKVLAEITDSVVVTDDLVLPAGEGIILLSITIANDAPTLTIEAQRPTIIVERGVA